MANCAIVGAGNVLQLTADAIETCTGVIVLSPSDYQKFNESGFALTIEQSQSILTAVLVLWAIAYSFRLIVKTLKTDEDVKDD